MINISQVILFIFVFIAFVLVFSGGIAFLFLYLRKRFRVSKSLEMVFLKVTLPRDNEYQIDVAEHLFTSLYSLHKGHQVLPHKEQERLSFEVVATFGGIAFYVVVPNDQLSFVEKQIHGSYSDAQIDTVEPWTIWDKGGYVEYTSLKLSGSDYTPMRTFNDMQVDPMNHLTSAMSKLGEGEAAVLQILIRPTGSAWKAAGKSFVDATRKNALDADPPKSVDDDKLSGITHKTSLNAFEAMIRLVSVSPIKENAKLNLKTMVNSFEQFRDPQHGKFSKSVFLTRKRRFIESFIYRYFPLAAVGGWRSFSVLTTEELATIFHFPNKDVKTPNINYVQARTSSAPSELADEGIYLGKSVFRGVDTKVLLPEDDRRRHMYIIGQTGTGKSEFMKYLAWQDICAGKGLAFIDPHGGAIDDLLERIPPERAEDVIYFDAGNRDRPMGLNILEAHTEEQKHLLINSFIGLLYKLYDPNRQGIMGPQLERAIRNVMLTAMVEPGNTLVEVLRLLISPEYAKTKIDLIQDEVVKSYWTEELAKTTDFHKSQMLGYFVSKFDRFVTDSLMRNIIGQSTSSFNFREVMDTGKILLIDLSKGKIGEENSNFLGLILVPRLLVAAMSRVDMVEERRRDFYLYVDEFQNFATPDFAQILSEARKYRLNLIVGNQFIAQIQDDIKDAVFGNVGSLITFRVGIDDATYLSHQFEENFSETDLTNNPIGKAYVRLLVHGSPTPPFSMQTDWPAMQAVPRDPSTGDLIKRMSNLRYGRDRAQVEREISSRTGSGQIPRHRHN